MKINVAIILSGNIEDSPYIRCYTDILDNLSISYDIVSWDRSYVERSSEYCFNYPSSTNLPLFKKLYDYAKYASFVKKIIVLPKYDLVIVFNIVNAIYLHSYLIKNFQNRYIVDIRDYSPLVPFIKKKLKSLIRNAKQIYISSPGWKKWLPKDANYIISHNVRCLDLLIENKPIQNRDKQVRIISTFGIMKDYKTDKKLIHDLRNSDKFIIEFNGVGTAYLQNYAKRNNILNVKFGGRYKKEDEKYLIKRSDFINILLPRKIARDGAMSNRFYQAIINRKPMIVNEGNIQTEFVKKYNLGLIIQSNKNLQEQLNNYIQEFNISKYEDGCKEITASILKDVHTFELSLQKILME